MTEKINKSRIGKSLEITSALLDENNVLDFHKLAHAAFNVDMDFIS